jgi:hypothetical protein
LTIVASICVAVIDGFDALPASEISRFWASGTSSIGSSTPRSPRATMIPPSAASMISSARAAACGFSIFATSGMSEPRFSSAASTFSRSLGRRTNETARMSMSWSTAKSIHAASDAPDSGSSASAPGRLTPWWELTAPPASTSAVISPPVTSFTFRRTLPSAR